MIFDTDYIIMVEREDYCLLRRGFNNWYVETRMTQGPGYEGYTKKCQVFQKFKYSNSSLTVGCKSKIQNLSQTLKGL